MHNITIYRQYFTESDCYNKGIVQQPKGIQVHSTGANNPYLHRYVGPDDGRLGPNKFNNTHNRPGATVCASAYIGKLQDGTLAIYQALPWEYRCWLSANGPNGNANRMGFIGFEVCEDNRHNREYFMGVVMDLSVKLCAYLCWKFAIPVEKVLDHSELHRLGIGSDHADITNWLKNFGYSMPQYRDAVRVAMQDGVTVTYVEGDKTWQDGPGGETPPAPIPDEPEEPTMEEKRMIVVAKHGETVNLRSGPGTDSKTCPVIAKVPVGSIVTQTMAKDGWAYIRWQDKQGYMMSEFLQPAPDEPEIPDTSERDAEVTAKLEAAQALIAEALDILNAKG